MKRIPDDVADRIFRMVDDGMSPKLVALRVGFSASAVYNHLRAREKELGRRAGGRQRKQKTVGWTGGREVRSTLCPCSSCVAARPERAALLRKAKP